MSYILGLSCFYHDSAACIIKDGNIIAALQEERFTRVKQDNSFPIHAIEECLKIANITLKDIEMFCYYEDSKLKFYRVIISHIFNAPKGVVEFSKNLLRYLKLLNIKKFIQAEFLKLGFKLEVNKIFISNHHLSHAASAFFPSPFEESAVLCVDGVGEWATTSIWVGKQNKLEAIEEITFPHSIGLLYSAFTYFCGFKVDSGEYKLMGLAPYGVPKYKEDILREIIKLNDDGTFILNRSYFDFEVGKVMTTKKFEDLFDGTRRLPEEKLTQREMDLAASIQAVLEEIMLVLVKNIQIKTRMKSLCMAGGVALNCVCNGKLLSSGIFDNIWIQPASGDAGTAIGAALAYYYLIKNSKREIDYDDKMQGGYLGNEYNNQQIKNQLDKFGAKFLYMENDDQIISQTANHIKEGKVVGWFQGRMEFGPRALGARSILGDPTDKTMQSIMNLKIKNRESFRPFAPVILNEEASKWFNINTKSPYMLVVAEIREDKKIPKKNIEDLDFFGIEKLKIERSLIPAVTHVDYSARIQTIEKKYNHKFYELVKEFYRITNCPILINTSFNVRGEPIVESPTDAYKCFMRTAMDCLVIGNYILLKSEQPKFNEAEDWTKIYQLD